MSLLQVAEDMRPVGPALSLCPLRRFGVSVLSARARKRSACQEIPTEIFVVYIELLRAAVQRTTERCAAAETAKGTANALAIA